MLTLINIIYNFKGILITLAILIIVKLVQQFSKKKRKIKSNDFIKFENMTPEEQKLFLITQINTNINKYDPKEREEIIKTCKFIYLTLISL